MTERYKIWKITKKWKWQEHDKNDNRNTQDDQKEMCVHMEMQNNSKQSRAATIKYKLTTKNNKW